MGLYQGDKILSGGGQSPYQVAKKSGFTGTEQEFNTLLASLGDNITVDELNAAIEAIPTPDVSGQINAHADNKSNPHGVTAAQVGAPTVSEMNAAFAGVVSKSGDTMTGDLAVHADVPAMWLKDTSGDRMARLCTADQSVYLFNSDHSYTDRSAIVLSKETSDLMSMLQLRTVKASTGQNDSYNIYHEGNKPTPSDIGAIAKFDDNITGGSANDTVAFWGEKGPGYCWINEPDQVVGQPDQYGFIISYTNGSDVFQIFRDQTDGTTYYRSGDNVNNWFQSWTEVVTADNMPGLATTTTAGIVMVDGTAGIGVNTENGNLFIKCATNNEIDGKEHSYNPITPDNLDYAVKAGIVNNANTLTEAEKTKVLTWIGGATSADVQEAKTAANDAKAAAANAAPMWSYGTEDLTAGSSPLETGKLYFVYE